MFLVCHFQPGSSRSREEGKRSLCSACRSLETLPWESPAPAVSQPLQDFEVSSVSGIRVRAAPEISVPDPARARSVVHCLCSKGTQLCPAPLHFHLSTPGSRCCASVEEGVDCSLQSSSPQLGFAPPAPCGLWLQYCCTCLVHGKIIQGHLPAL